MKRGYLYTVLFMVVLSAVFTFALAASYEGFKPAIEQNAALQQERAVLYAFGLEEGLSDDEATRKYDEVIRDGGLNGMEVPVYEESGQVMGYALPFEGAGLWGTIRGYLGLNAALNQATGLVFTEQNETPGLGGRIEEPQYKEQFRGLPITKGIPIRYGDNQGEQLDAVTGATQTSSAMLRILNNALDGVFAGEVD
ncbi:MAG: FMN-binding protein [Eubacteriales bacterium]|nr:FMN-binding protein [Eubacteriales bacterium]